jgi:hypothetical protein
MTVQIAQDVSFINDVRNAASMALIAAERGSVNQVRWNNCFGGAGRLGSTSFFENNDGLAKASIDTANGVLYQLNAWLDEAGQGRRAALMAIANI